MNAVTSLRLSRNARGAALVVTLIFVSIIAVLLTAFSITSRFELGTANAHYRGMRADLLADTGAHVAMARIATATENGRFWASAPGRIVTRPIPPSGGSPGELSLVDLSSGIPGDVNHAANLNRPNRSHAGGAVLNDTSIPLLLRWIYVFKDGTHTPLDAPPAYDKDNPAVGRYAFWADDDTARINWNTATTRSSSSLSLSHPGRIELTALADMTTAEVGLIENFRLNRHFFNTSTEPLFIGSEAISVLVEQEAFSFTHFNHSPERSALGTGRRVLTTKATLANGMDFFDITTTENADPGLLSSLDYGKVAALFRTLYLQFQRTDRPLFEGSSFVGKYGDQQTAQIVLDLIDYVRAADSALPFVEPLRGSFAPASGSFSVNTNSLDFLANGRKPYITQVAVRVTTASANLWRCEYAIEIYLPPADGGDPLDLTKLQAYIYRADGSNATRNVTAANISGSDTTLGPGQYRTLLFNEQIATEPPNPMPLRTAIINPATGMRLDIAPLTNDVIMYEYDIPAPASVFNARSVSVDDPFVNKRKENWSVGTAAFNRPSTTPLPTSTLGTAAAGTPPQDADATGMLTSAGIRFAAPGAGVQSSADIGRIHTGGKRVPETPWRTLRLQPGFAGIPDWVLLDDFTTVCPVSTPRERAVLQPHESAVGGRINLNASLYPFAKTEEDARRVLPLLALLQNAPNGSGSIDSATAATLADQIISQTPAASSPGGNLRYPGNDDFEQTYLYIGQAAEVAGIADGGEASEELVRQLAGVATVRSNVYTIYSIGQALSQQANGNLNIRGERRTQTAIERLPDHQFRILARKELQP